MKQWGYEIKAVTTLADEHGVVLTEASGVPKQFIRQDLQKIDPGKVIVELVHWVGYDDPTWESAQPGFKDAIAEYEASLKKK